MKLFILFLYLSLLSLPLLAQRVIVTKTSNKNNLHAIYTKLQSLHVKMFVDKRNNYYFIYTKEYQTEERAEANLRKIRTLFPNAKLPKSKKPKVQIKDENEIKDEKKWLLGVGIGTSSIDGGSGSSYTLKMGYFTGKHFLSEASYSYSSIDQTTLSNIYLTENYYYDITQNSDIYIGSLLGYSRLLINSKESTPSGSLIYGLQVGASYDIFGSIPLSLTYQHIFLNHTIAFTSSTGTVTINTNSQNVIELGIAYKF